MVKRHSQSLAEMHKERAWTAGEEQVIAEARTGEVVLGSGDLPDAQSDRVEVRAGLIRHLVLGGCDGAPVPDKGVGIFGAWVPDVLDLEGCESPQDLRLTDCRLIETPILMDARLGAVYLPSCHVPGISAHRLRVTRDVLLNQKFAATGPVNLSRSQIGGGLACNDGRFDGAGGVALDGDGMKVATDILLRDGFHATGQVNLRGTRIGGQLACTKGRFDGAGGVALTCNAIEAAADVFLSDGFHATGQVDLRRARISGHLTCQGGKFEGGFYGEGMNVGAGFFWNQVVGLAGPVELTDAEVGRLHDDEQSWKGANLLHLSGFRYARLSGDMTIAQRLEWLSRKYDRPILPRYAKSFGNRRQGWSPAQDWIPAAQQTLCDPQPYTQLAKVLREQGVVQGAARVLEERDRRVRLASYHRSWEAVDGSWRAGLRSVLPGLARPFDALFGLIFGYGHRPGRALWLVAAIWLGTFLLYGQVYRAGQMAPNSDVVLTSAAWIGAVQGYETGSSDAMPLVAWQKTESAKDYETFSAGLYALDLFVPLDALGQESAWAPSWERGFWGALGYWMRMPVEMAGWIITAVGAAALTGLVGRKD